ncbi:iron hydrogenase [Candidatus Parcubacteria bacterium]|nr:iron hydrogenase [Candidatus Parcubacteria bacterium]
MRYIKENVLAKPNIASLANFLVLASIAVFTPFFIHVQWLTGSIVNAVLIIVLFTVGVRSALVLCLIPSLMALAGGLIPPILAPIIPFIMMSNVILVLAVDRVYYYFKNDLNGYWFGLVSGAVLKFAFIYFSLNIIIKLLIKQELVAKVAQMMSWPQLATAITGGFIAWIFLKKIKRI